MPLPVLSLASATAALRRGEVVAYPTETFYGLAVLPSDAEALARLVRLKGRDTDKPVSLILGKAEVVSDFATSLTPATIRLISLAWPGPLTVVLPAKDSVARVITGGTGTVAVRVPSHAGARMLADSAGGAITATSANRQNMPPARTAEEVEAQFPDGLAGVFNGERAPGDLPSTLVRPVGGTLHVLRRGAVDLPTLREWWSGEIVDA
ncbi:MAG TPA: L-threonylcarbamoyladenylate synthase [Candidatus Latescibacteria bacterium]|nr:L-threonylcarbamoyladenylate synthase [Candidatus Latescibacterota bacterium]HOS65211.1 L-threonylcarbamoyladenylate synthase [Candidatus Latescibacterota bacterium]HPK74946.1 L-threonylcarbamoyladenylate synthase [Candidatus Latescibacterota bacterium]